MRSRRAAALCASIGMATVALLRPLHAQYSADTGLKFVEHTLATELRGGYQSLIVDLNKDGKPDIIALASNLPDLLWFENPGWQRHV